MNESGMTNTKFAEWWIRQGEHEGDTWGDKPFYSVVSNTPEDIKNPIHVIEYSAYEALKKELADARWKLVKIEQQLKAEQARSANYKEKLELILYCQLGGHLSPNQTGKKCLDDIREALAAEIIPCIDVALAQITQPAEKE